VLLTLLARFSAAVNHALAFDLSRIIPYLSQLRIKCIAQRSYHLCRAGQSKVLPKTGKFGNACQWPCSEMQPRPQSPGCSRLLLPPAKLPGTGKGGRLLRRVPGMEPLVGQRGLGGERGAGLRPGSREAPGWQDGRVNKECLAVCTHR